MKYSNLGVVLGLLLCSASSQGEEQKKYTIGDLQALAKEKSWNELVEHLDDIPPAQRGDPWKKLAEQGTIGMIDGLNTDDNPLGALIMADQFTKRYPFLKKSPTFMKRRAEVGLNGFEECYRRSYGVSTCAERLLPFVMADTGNVDLAIKAAHLVMSNQTHEGGIPFYRAAAMWSKGAAKACEADRIDEALGTALGLPSNEKLAKQGIDVAQLCWPHVKAMIISKINANSGGYFSENACVVLKQKKAPEAKKCD